MTNIVAYLLKRKLVVEISTVNSRKVGRKAILIQFNPDAMSIVSVDIEISKIVLALTDLSGEISYIKEILIEGQGNEFEILNKIREEIDHLTKNIE